MNGSPRVNGNTAIAVNEMAGVFHAEGVETDIVQVGNKDVRGCIACGQCAGTGKCVFDDIVNELAPKFEEAGGLVVASPVYYASANATLIAVLDRLFYSTHFDKTMKVGVSVVCARRGGCSATFDELQHAGCFQSVLEQHPRQGAGAGGHGRRRKADNACARQKHDIPYEMYRTGQGTDRSPGNRGACMDAFHKVI